MEKDEEVARAVEMIIRVFHSQYPEFMQDGYEPDRELMTGTYHRDERLVWYMEDIGVSVDMDEDDS